MFSLRRPTHRQIERFLSRMADAPFSYAEVGASRTEPPPGYRVGRIRGRLGQGEAAFLRAKEEIRCWTMFPPRVVELHDRRAPIEPGTLAVPLLRGPGFWLRTACRIVYVVDEHDDQQGTTRFGFAYGTLDEHLERGEERFLVEWRRGDDSVWYDLLAFSRPNRLVARLGVPVIRVMQSKFRRQSLAAMTEAVALDVPVAGAHAS